MCTTGLKSEPPYLHLLPGQPQGNCTGGENVKEKGEALDSLTTNSFFSFSLSSASSASYPAVALPYLEVSFFSAFFFVAYLTLGQIFLMRLLITAAYGAYREELFKRIQKRETRTHTAFSSAFYILTDSRNSNNCTNGIVLKEWLRLVKQVRPKFRKEVARAIFHAPGTRISFRNFAKIYLVFRRRW